MRSSELWKQFAEEQLRLLAQEPQEPDEGTNLSEAEHRALTDQLEAMGAQAEEYLSMLPDSGDVLLVILKGHLIAEELLNAIVSRHFPNPKYLIEARLKFSQLVKIARGLSPEFEESQVWVSLSRLNALRNALAHNLRPSDISKKIQELVQSATESGEIPIPPGTALDGDLVKYCMGPIIAGLHMIERTHTLLNAVLQANTDQNPAPKGQENSG